MRGVVALVAIACGAPAKPPPPPAPPAAPAERPLEEPLLLMRHLDTPSHLLTDGRDVFVTDDGDVQIWRVKRDGSGKKVSIGTATASFAAAAVDDEHLFFIPHGSDAAIMRVPKDGSDVPWPVTVAPEPGPMALDGEHVYYAADGRIHRVRKDGVGEAQELAEDEYPFAMLVVGDELWWSTGDYGSIMSIDKTGGAPVAVVDEVSFPTRMVADATHVYWMDTSAMIVARVPKRGDKPRAAEIVVQVPGIDDLAVDDRYVYWSDAYAGTINRVPKDGGQPYTLFWQLDRPTRLVVDEEGVIYVHAGHGAVIRRPKGLPQKNIKRAISK